MDLIIYFTIYFIIISLLGWYANRHKYKKPIQPPYIDLFTSGLTENQIEKFRNAVYQLGRSAGKSEKELIELGKALRRGL